MDGKLIRSFISEQRVKIVDDLRWMQANKISINMLLEYIKETKKALGSSCNSEYIKSVMRKNKEGIIVTLQELEQKQRKLKYEIKMYSRCIAMARTNRKSKKHGLEAKNGESNSEA